MEVDDEKFGHENAVVNALITFRIGRLYSNADPLQ